MADNKRSDTEEVRVLNPHAIPTIPDSPMIDPRAVPAAKAPSDFVKGRIDRSSAEKIIKRGESVSFNGRVISHVDDLPTEAELAAGDEDRERQAEAHLRQRRVAIDAEEATITQSRASRKK